MSNNKAVVALIVSGIALLISIAAAALALIAASQQGNASEPTAAPSVASPQVTEDAQPATPTDGTRIEYELTTDGMSVTSLSYVVIQDGQPTMVDDDGAPAPFRQVVDVPKGLDLADFSVTGVGGSTSRTLTCTIRVNGLVVDTQTASGAYPVTSCVAEKPAA